MNHSFHSLHHISAAITKLMLLLWTHSKHLEENCQQKYYIKIVLLFKQRRIKNKIVVYRWPVKGKKLHTFICFDFSVYDIKNIFYFIFFF